MASATRSFTECAGTLGCTASTSGVELEAKFQLAELMEDAPALDVRANYSRYWSRVDDIPGPDNRLDGQASQTGNVGIDYRLKGMPLTLGGAAAYNMLNIAAAVLAGAAILGPIGAVLALPVTATLTALTGSITSLTTLAQAVKDDNNPALAAAIGQL